MIKLNGQEINYGKLLREQTFEEIRNLIWK